MINKKKDGHYEEETPVVLKNIITCDEYAALDNEDKKSFYPINPKYEKLSLFAKIVFSLCAVCTVIYIISLFSKDFSDFFNLHIGSFFRMVTAFVSGIIPFSLAEMIIILIPVLFAFTLYYIIKFRCLTWKTTIMSMLNLIAVLCLIFSLFVVNLGIGYRGSTLDEKLNLEQNNPSKEDLYHTAMHLADLVNKEAELLHLDADGASIMPYSFNEMNKKLIAAYDSFCEEYDFLNNYSSRLKPVMLSNAMSYTHITGVYTFFTGEANINVAFPDYTIPYTAAHELAHQRGIAREDEANMIAFLVCIRSDDAYIRYSGYLNMYEYVSNALYSADGKLYSEVRGKLNDKINSEHRAYNKFFEKYKESKTSEVSDKINDTYLQIQGTAGTRSYGMVVDLTVAFFKDKNIIP